MDRSPPLWTDLMKEESDLILALEKYVAIGVGPLEAIRFACNVLFLYLALLLLEIPIQPSRCIRGNTSSMTAHKWAF